MLIVRHIKYTQIKSFRNQGQLHIMNNPYLNITEKWPFLVQEMKMQTREMFPSHFSEIQ